MVNVDKLKSSRPGMTAETTEGNYASAEAGLWRHPETGEEAVTSRDPLYGDAMSQAFARVGFVRVGDEPKGYRKEMQLGTTASTGDDALKGVLARLAALENENAQLQQKLAAEQEVKVSDAESATEEGKK